METSTDTRRIEIFDGLRVLAILMVFLFHYYYRFDGRFYDYSLNISSYFKYGYLGVQLFFIISGFVIALTLTKCRNFFTFIKKRLIRLIPGMLVCSILTFSIFSIFDTESIFPHAKDFNNLVISNTFINPAIINTFFGTSLRYVDGAYWSIWVELQFYILAGIVYFLSPKHFVKNYAVLAIAMVVLYYLSISGYGSAVLTEQLGGDLYKLFIRFMNLISIFRFNLWFLIGILINELYLNKRNLTVALRTRYYLLLGVLFILQIIIVDDLYTSIFITLLMIFFYIFLSKPHLLKILGGKTLSKIGVASYSMYLIHQFIGVLIINKLSPYFGPLNWVLPFFVTIGVIYFGLWSYKLIEVPLGKELRKALFRT